MHRGQHSTASHRVLNTVGIPATCRITHPKRTMEVEVMGVVHRELSEGKIRNPASSRHIQEFCKEKEYPTVWSFNPNNWEQESQDVEI